jgi:hypothetical protein
MEDIEITSWLILDAIKDVGEVVEEVGDLQTGHWKSVFCTVEDDFIELGYMDTASSYLRVFDDKEEFELAIERRREDVGEAPYDEIGFDDSFAGDDVDNDEDFEFDDSESF